jgi:hypothetical protein
MHDPLLLRFAIPLPKQESPAVRFDPLRQVSAINPDGPWIPVWGNSQRFGRGDTKTAVASESTDHR